MPNRIIKESICSSDTIEQLTPLQENFFYRLIVNCDDYGRMDARPPILKARLFPLKERFSLKDIEGALQALADAGCVRLYTVNSKPYLYLPTWEVHQSIRAKKSKFPAPDEADTEAAGDSCKHLHANEINCMQMHADACICSRNPIQSESNPNPNTNTGKASMFRKPTLAEVLAYCQKEQLTIDPEYFFDYYEANGWKVGKNSMKDWKAAARNWAKREKSRSPGQPSHAGYDIDAFEASGAFDNFDLVPGREST